MTVDALSTQIRSGHWRDALAGKLENYADSGNPDLTKNRLKGAVKDLEALLFYEMLKEMRKTTQEGFMGKGMGNDIYASLFDMEMAKVFAERGLGIGDLILKQITGREEKNSAGPPSPLKDLPRSSQKKEADPVSRTDPPKENPGSVDQAYESPLQSPVEGRVSSNYGWRSDPFSGEQKFHNGIDIAVPSGQEIHPIKTGEVIFSGMTQGYGNTVVIDHGDGYVSKYGHNLTNLVSAGDQVTPGQVIALVGNTGKSTGPHLHLEVHYQGKRVNPQLLLKFQESTLG